MGFWLALFDAAFPHQVPNAGSSPSSIVATYSTPGTSGSPPSHASCTSAHWARTRVPHTLVETLRADVVIIAMGILLLTFEAGGQNNNTWIAVILKFGLPYLSISISLNIILTLMIVIRLLLHNRGIRAAMGSPARIDRLYKAIVTMLIESSALYAVSSFLVIGPWVAGYRDAITFWPILTQTQVNAFPRSQSSAGRLMSRRIG